MQNYTKLENLVFSGAGVKGIAYAGVLKALTENDLITEVKRVAGSSIGSLAAALIAVGYDPQQAIDKLSNINIKKLIDYNPIMIIKNLFNGGLQSGKKLEKLVKDLIAEATGDSEITFEQLYQAKESNNNIKELYITACDLDSKEAKVFSHINTPNMKIYEAVRMSISVPIFFTPYKNKLDNHKYVDGGTQLNHPINIFDNQYFIDNKGNQHLQNDATLGFAMVDSKFIKKLNDLKLNNLALKKDDNSIIKLSNNYLKMLEGILALSINNPQQDALRKEEARYVYIDNQGVNTLEFNINNQQKNKLIEAGYNSTIEFINSYYKNNKIIDEQIINSEIVIMGDTILTNVVEIF